MVERRFNEAAGPRVKGSLLSVVFERVAAYSSPVARFGGLAWLIAAGVLLPKRRLLANT